MTFKVAGVHLPGSSAARLTEMAPIFAAGCIHGPAGVGLGTRCYLCEQRSQLILDARTLVGEHVAQFMAEILTRRVGEDGFRVERLDAEVQV